MKRFIRFLLTAVFIAFCSLAFAIETEESNTEHFMYSAPKGWDKEISGDSVFYYAKDIGGVSGGYVAVIEQMDDNLLSYADKLDIYYDSMINAAVWDNGSGRIIKDKEIDGRPAKLVLGGLKTKYATYDAAFVFLIADQYVFCQCYIDPRKTPSVLFDTIDKLSDNIRLNNEHADIKSPDILFEEAVYEIWGDDVISARAGKYPEFSVYQSGMPDYIRFESEEKILELLRQVDRIRKNVNWDFVDIFIRVHTDLVDIYGNERIDEVITIKFTPETLDKMNYEKVSKYNLPLIADVWREHPVMNK